MSQTFTEKWSKVYDARALDTGLGQGRTTSSIKRRGGSSLFSWSFPTVMATSSKTGSHLTTSVKQEFPHNYKMLGTSTMLDIYTLKILFMFGITINRPGSRKTIETL